jgi:hypothetical protein
MKFMLAVLAIAALNLATPIAGADVNAASIDRVGKKPVFNPIIMESEEDKKKKKKKKGDGSGSEEPDCD